MSLLKIDNLRYLDFPPLNLALETGEIVSISGQSGSGKSLLLRTIADLDPHSGSMYLAGRECAAYPPHEWRRNVGLLPTESQWWEDTVAAHFPHSPLADAIVSEWAAMLQLDREIFSRQINRLSSGEKQRLALIRLLINSPRVLLLDEPTASLDTGNTGLFERIVTSYIADNGAGAIWISHNPDQARRLAKRHFRFEGKKLVEHPFDLEEK